MYVLFFNVMIDPQVRTVIFTDIDSKTFSKLYSQYGDSLSCPCSTISISYETFVSNTITFHPVCSSFFVNQQWIDALYIPSRSKFGVGDFRTTAVSQFQLLSSLCSIAQDIIFRTKIDLNNKELLTTHLLHESKIELEINAITQSFKSDLSTQIMSLIDYIQLITETNNFVTSLNTNVYFAIADPIYSRVGARFESLKLELTTDQSPCGIENPVTSAAFYIRYEINIKKYDKYLFHFLYFVKP